MNILSGLLIQIVDWGETPITTSQLYTQNTEKVRRDFEAVG